MKKCDIHLQLNYRNGKQIEQKKIQRARDELIATFGSFAVPDRRTWKYDGVKYVEVVKFEIITTGDRVTKKRLTNLKESLNQSFRQVDILITSYDIQVV